MKACSSHYRKHGTDFAYNQLKEARRKFKRLLRKHKRECWKQFCEESVDMKSAAKLNKIIQGTQSQSLGLIKGIDGTPCLDPQECLKTMVDSHFPGNTEQSRLSHRGEDCRLDDQTASFITVEKVKLAIHSFGNLKAAGPDGLKPIVLKHFGPHALNRLTDLFRASYLLGYVPAEWRKAKVVFIPKSGKASYDEARSFRPITLSSFIIKTMERVILWHLQETTLQERPLHRNQHAFRTGRSTETALTRFASNIETAFGRNEYAMGVFLDIQGAFDNISTNSIVNSLRERDIDNKLCQWYQHYLDFQRIEVSYRGTKISRFLTRGTPQRWRPLPFSMEFVL